MIWSWVLTAMGCATFILAGRKVWWAWYAGLVTQCVWLAYGIVTQQWGFIVGTIFYTTIYTGNAIKWTKERNDHRDRA